MPTAPPIRAGKAKRVALSADIGKILYVYQTRRDTLSTNDISYDLESDGFEVRRTFNQNI